MAPSVDGERARQLAITLLGAKDGGRHHQERALALTSLSRQMRRCAQMDIKRKTGAEEVSTVPLHYVSKQIATLHRRGEQRRHQQRNRLDE